jgi:hypothetical protein
MTNEAFARVKIDALLAAQGWHTQDLSADTFIRYQVEATGVTHELFMANGIPSANRTEGAFAPHPKS